MLAKHIEAQLFHRKNISFVFLGTCGSKNSVAEISLIKNSVKKDRLTVEGNYRSAVDFFYRYRTNRKIRAYAVGFGFKRKSVKIRIVTAPFAR